MSEITVRPDFPVVVLISGQGSNLQALIDQQDALDINIVAVISNRPSVLGLERASQAGIPAITLDHREYSDRNQFDQAMAKEIDKLHPALIVLAGYMRILSDDFVRHFRGRLINIHPSLLPAYRGLHTHRRVLDAKESYHGTSVHYVSEELDGGPVITQARLKVENHDSEQTLLDRVQAMEHQLYPLSVGLIRRGEIGFKDQKIEYRGKKLDTPLVFDEGAITLKTGSGNP